jgi:TPR repeat protein
MDIYSESRRTAPKTVCRHLLVVAFLVLCWVLIGPQARAEGDATVRAIALTRLGDLYLEGRLKPYDPVIAFGFYSEAAELGNENARVRVAEMTVRGQGNPRNVEIGLSQLRALAVEGSLKALVSLGDIYSRGHAGHIDAKAALKAYTDAAGKNDLTAIMRLAEVYRIGTIAKKDSGRSFHYLKNASDAGSSFAMMTAGQGLIDGEFKKSGFAASGINLLQQAEDRGSPEASVAFSMLRHDEHSVPRSVSERLDLLIELARTGNTAAALKLVAIYREGHSWDGGGHTRKNTAEARTILAQVAPKLSPGVLAREQFLVDVLSSPKHRYPKLYERLNEIAPPDRPSVMRRLLRANSNAYMYFVQRLLEEKKFYKGKANGTLTGATIRAINAFCASLNARELCRSGPLSPSTTHFLTFAF